MADAVRCFFKEMIMKQLQSFIYLHNTLFNTNNQDLAKILGVEFISLWDEIDANFNLHLKPLSEYYKCHPDTIKALKENRHWSGKVLVWLCNKI